MIEVSEKTSAKIYSYVRKDLEPSLFSVTWRIAGSILIGGLLSLLFCGQFGVGFSDMARHLNHTVHASMGAVQCAIICGSIFALAPIVILRLVSSALLFRKILLSYGVAQAVLLLAAGLIMYSTGSFVSELINVLVWSASAFLSFRLFGMIVDQLHRLPFAYGSDI